MMGCKCTARLGVFALAISLGIVSGLFMMLFAWYALWYGHGVAMVAQWGEIYSGYAATIRGGFVGAGWGFLEGFISGLILAIVYNFCLCCCKAVCKSNEMCEKPVKGKK